MSQSNFFPIKFWKFLPTSFGWGCYHSKLLNMTQNYYKSPLKVHELNKSELNSHPDIFQNVNTVQQQGSLISISSVHQKFIF